jgi:hypothetical protein
MATDQGPKSPMTFESVLQVDVPTGRNGKHKEVVSQLLRGLEQLAHGSALKIPLTQLPDTKENIRSALNRATREKGINVSTSSDDDHLYVWKS